MLTKFVVASIVSGALTLASCKSKAPSGLSACELKALATAVVEVERTSNGSDTDMPNLRAEAIDRLRGELEEQAAKMRPTDKMKQVEALAAAAYVRSHPEPNALPGDPRADQYRAEFVAFQVRVRRQFARLSTCN